MKLRLLLFTGLVALLVPGVHAQSPRPSAKWEKEIAAFEAKDREEAPPKHALLFIGSSSIRYWTSLATDFPEHRVINRGFGGSMISDSVDFVDRIVLPYEPRAIFFYAGGNDLNAGKSPATVAADFRAFAEKVHAKLPETEINYLSTGANPKRWPQVEQTKAANALIEQYCRATPHLRYIDVFTHMLGSDGQPKQGIYRDDQLHMNPEGYKIWVGILRPLLPPGDVTPSSTQ